MTYKESFLCAHLTGAVSVVIVRSAKVEGEEKITSFQKTNEKIHTGVAVCGHVAYTSRPVCLQSSSENEKDPKSFVLKEIWTFLREYTHSKTNSL